MFRKKSKKFQKIMIDSRKKFTHTYNRFDRPVVGIYHSDRHYIETLSWNCTGGGA